MMRRRSLKRKAAEMETPAEPATVTSRFKFLSLPGEMRNMIYRLLFRTDSTIDACHHHRLSAQFLCTCRQVRDGGLTILYGENTFHFEIRNTHGHFYNGYGSPLYFEGKTMTLVSRFHIVVAYTDSHKLEPIREAVRDFVNEVLARATQIDFIHLECNLHSEVDDEIDWNIPSFYRYSFHDGGRKEVVSALRTWFGQLHNVREVQIHGLKKSDAAILRKRLQSSEVMGKTLLTDMYTALETQVRGTEFCEDDLREALLAVERDDMEGFKEASTAIAEALSQRLEGVKDVIRQFAEGNESMDVDGDGDTKEKEKNERGGGGVL